MLLACLLCEHENQEGNREFEQGAPLREHLIDVHSKTIAKAFLCPDISDPNHIWLLGCVKYRHQDIGSTSTSPSSEDFDEKSSNLVEVLAALLTNSDENNEGSVEDVSGTESSRKRPSKYLNDSGDSEPKRAHIELNEEILGGFSFDPTLLFANAEEIACASGLTETKNYDKKTCKVCRVRVKPANRHRHVMEVHVAKVDMFTCSACDFMNSYSIYEARNHVKKMHSGGDATAQSNELKYRTLIQQWMRRCFDSKPSDIKVDDEDETLESDMEVEGERSPLPTIENETIDDKICQLCFEESKYPGRHIAQKHLRKPLYECPICEGFGSYESCTVVKHMTKVHSEEMRSADIQPISNLEKYSDEIRDLQTRCFPNRPMKLVRPVSLNGKTRERHICGICQQQVAQSDRQRHVFHRHLKVKRMFECPLCNFASNYDIHRVKWHIKWMHKDEYEFAEPVSHENKYRDKIDNLNDKCFPGWHHRKRPFWWLDNEEAVNRQEQVKAKHQTSEQVNHTVEMPEEPSTSEECSMDYHEDNMMDSCKMNDSKSRVSVMKLESKLEDNSKAICRQCFMEMSKEDRQIHVYRHHLKEPRLYECPLCDFSHHACSSDVRSHIKFTHRDNAEVAPKANLLEFSAQIAEWNEKCFPGWINRRLPVMVVEDFNKCRLCNEDVRQTSRHIAEVHLKIPLHQCPLCEYGAAESRLVARHIKNIHNEKENKGLEPIANVVTRRADFSACHDQCFPGRPKRLSNITISDEGRRAKCKLCGATISKKNRMTHILEIHLIKPVFECSECDFTHNFDRNTVVNHQKVVHKGEKCDVTVNIMQHKNEVTEVGKSCFPDWDANIDEYSGQK